MAYFTPDFLQFFKELAANNNKDWFNENKKRYEREVKKAFELFITDMISRLAKDDKAIQIQAKDAIFRIYRDIRFSKDKTPYKIQASAIITPGGRKDMLTPGLYIELTPEHARAYSGVYMPDKESLYRIRTYISTHGDELRKLLRDKDFVNRFGEIRGEKNKVIPKEFKEAAVKEELIYNKQFYYFGEMKPEVVLEDDLVERIFAFYMAAKPLKEFFTRALKS